MREALLLLFVCAFFAFKVEAQTDFYKGKQIRIIVGASAGAASDLYARVVANHFPEQIPGKPDIIVQNMPGGGSITAATYDYSVDKPDGFTLGPLPAPIHFGQTPGQTRGHVVGLK